MLSKELILSYLTRHPLYSIQDFNKLRSDEEMVSFIDKCIESITPLILSDSLLLEKTNATKVKMVLIEYLSAQINRNRTFFEKFDYQTIKNITFQIYLKLSNF